MQINQSEEMGNLSLDFVSNFQVTHLTLLFHFFASLAVSLCPHYFTLLVVVYSFQMRLSVQVTDYFLQSSQCKCIFFYVSNYSGMTKSITENDKALCKSLVVVVDTDTQLLEIISQEKFCFCGGFYPPSGARWLVSPPSICLFITLYDMHLP